MFGKVLRCMAPVVVKVHGTCGCEGRKKAVVKYRGFWLSVPFQDCGDGVFQYVGALDQGRLFLCPEFHFDVTLHT